MGSDASPHSVIHRESVVHRLFVAGCEARDGFFGWKRVGQMSATQHRYATGMSLPRWILLVFVELPLFSLLSVAGWASPFLAFVWWLGNMIETADKVGGVAVLMGMCYLLLALLVGIAIFMIYVLLIVWAKNGPNGVTMAASNILRMRRGKYFPGPIALFKKFILSFHEGTTPLITWTSQSEERRR